MIPKIIHYCWFGGKPIPEQYQEYMKSWEKYMLSYEIKRWDESNFNIDSNPFCRQAYDAGKYAFVSDYARLKILYEEGGIYLDTDVEILKPLDNILDRGPFMGFEKESLVTPHGVMYVNLGLGFAVEPHNPIIREILDYYESRDFNPNQLDTIVVIVTDILNRHGLKPSKMPIEVAGITIYPWEYFCPIAFLEKKLSITDNTYTIHHYSATWLSKWDIMSIRFGRFKESLKRLIGPKCVAFLKGIRNKIDRNDTAI